MNYNKIKIKIRMRYFIWITQIHFICLSLLTGEMLKGMIVKLIQIIQLTKN